MKFGTIPSEPPADASLDDCAPQFAQNVRAMMAALEISGFDPVINESVRTDARQAWLYGMGREYDDGRGIVTYAPTAQNGWHTFGLAADIISKAHGWDSEAFFDALEQEAPNFGLTSGSTWKRKDRPHVQWSKCRAEPSDESRTLYASGGVEAVWNAVGAN